MASASRTSRRTSTIAVAFLGWTCASCSRPVTPSEVEGLWRQSGRYPIAAYAETRLEFRSDGTFSFVRMPGEYFFGSKSLPLTVAADGRWTLNHEGGDSRVELETLTIDGEETNYGSSMSVSGGGGDVSLSFPLNDPDGQWLLFAKAQLVLGESHRRDHRDLEWSRGPRSR